MNRNREAIWVVLSDLYLDTELEDFTLDHIANTIRESHYSLDEVRSIDRYEVFPLLQQNLLSVAGVWGAFESEWVVKECGIRKKKRKSLWYRGYCNFYYLIFGGMHKPVWKALEKRIDESKSSEQ